MEDFSYDSYDQSALKVAFSNLRAAEQQGFWMGIAVGSPLGVWLISRPAVQHKFAAGPASKAFSALFVGSLIYGARIFNAKQQYQTVAAKINRKYSVILNKSMTYN